MDGQKVAAGSSGREDTRQVLIATGARIIREKGYNHAGLQEILQASGVPKGSFYHFFGSKEQFGLAVIEADAEAHDRELARFLDDRALAPLERLSRYFLYKCEVFESIRCREGCLLGNLGQELADQNETFRARIERFFADWQRAIADCLREAKSKSELPPDLDPDALAGFLVSSWEGAVLQMKVAKDTTPLRRFHTFVFGALLKT
jgi:TetR/AcrR family transcriptional repressor of nem operon